MVMNCEKITFKTHADAQISLTITHFRNKKHVCVKSYQCKECGLWHLTSQNKDRITKKNKMKLSSKKEKYKKYKKL